jgi:KRAB domain-containing zinc finger protein
MFVALPECRILLHRLLNCEHCDKVLTSVTELNLHRSLNHQATHQGEHVKDSGPRKMKYKCSECHHNFKCLTYLERHVQYFHGDDPMGKVLTNNRGIKVFVCLVCQREFASPKNVAVHISTKHTNSRPFQCDLCQKCFPSIGILNQHKQVHSGRIWSCDICSAKLTKKYGLKIHTLQVHSQSVKCKICGKIFKSALYLPRHMSSMHAKEKPFACNLCDKAFNKECYLNAHFKQMHSNLVFCCESCNFSSKSKQNLARHIQRKHSKNPPVFSCNKCPAKFAAKEYCTRHMRLVHTTGCVKCEVCGDKFKHTEYLNIHMKSIHTGLVLHCAQCKYATRRKYDLRLHINKHHPGRANLKRVWDKSEF